MNIQVVRLILGMVGLSAFTSLAWAEAPSYRVPKDADEAVARIEELGGTVRYLTAKEEALEVDFRFATDELRDEHLQYVNALPNVIVLRLNRTPITDAGLAHVGEVETLQQLHLAETSVSDAGLEHLTKLKALAVLNLYSTKVTDAGVKQFADMSTLRSLYVDATEVKPAAIAEMKKQRPDLEIVPDPAALQQAKKVVRKVAAKLLADAEADFAQRQKDLEELAPRADQLKKEEEAAKKRLDASRKKADELRKQRDKVSRESSDAERAANDAKRRAEQSPDDKNRQNEYQVKSRTAAEKKSIFEKAQQEYEGAQKTANADQQAYDDARDLAERGRNAKKNLETSQEILDGARLRVEYANR